MNIKDIARIANVSISTVSRVLNDKPGVKQNIREHVKKVIAENNFVPNLLAVNLLKKKTNVIGIIVPVIHSYYARIIDAISDMLIENGYSIMVASSRLNMDEEIENFSMLIEKQVEGIIYFPSIVTENHKKITSLYSERIPIVMIEGNPKELELPNVTLDNLNGTRRAVKYLVESGHKKIAMIKGNEGNWIAKEREDSFRTTLKENGVEVNEAFICNGEFSMKSGYDGVYTLFKGKDEKPTAVFFCNDTMAIGGIRAFAELGIKLPEEVSIVGFDDIVPASYCVPALTTVRQDQEEMGKQAAKMLIDYFENRSFKISKIVLEQKLVIRESVKKI